MQSILHNLKTNPWHLKMKKVELKIWVVEIHTEEEDVRMVLILKIVYTKLLDKKELMHVLDHSNFLKSLMMPYVKCKEECSNVC